MAQNFSKSFKPTAVYGVLSTTAKTVYGDKLDMANYEGVCFTALFKSTAGSTGTAVLTVVGTNTSTAASTNYVLVAGSSIAVTNSTTANDKRAATIDVYHSQKRYIRCKLVKQAKILLNGILAQQYSERYEPAAASTTLAAATAAACKVFVAMQSTST